MHPDLDLQRPAAAQVMAKARAGTLTAADVEHARNKLQAAEARRARRNAKRAATAAVRTVTLSALQKASNYSPLRAHYQLLKALADPTTVFVDDRAATAAKVGG
jgi:hypothetical protein